MFRTIATLMVFPCGDWYDKAEGDWEEQCVGMSDDYFEVEIPAWAYDLWDYPEDEYLFHVLEIN
jgi:hypothetical protein